MDYKIKMDYLQREENDLLTFNATEFHEPKTTMLTI